MHFGVGFRPKDEELIHYLRLKKAGKDLLVEQDIAQVNFYKSEPWELPLKSKVKSSDRMWPFFHRQVRIGGGGRGIIKRKTEMGTWRLTGKERKVRDRNGIVIGIKRYFTYCHVAKGIHVRTNWVMHEYSLLPDRLAQQTDHVICRLEERPNRNFDTIDHEEGGLINNVMPDFSLPLISAPSTGHVISRSEERPNWNFNTTYHEERGDVSSDLQTELVSAPSENGPSEESQSDKPSPSETLMADNCDATKVLKYFSQVLLSPDQPTIDFEDFSCRDFDQYNELVKELSSLLAPGPIFSSS